MNFGGSDCEVVYAILKRPPAICAVIGVAGKVHGPRDIIVCFDVRRRRQNAVTRRTGGAVKTDVVRVQCQGESVGVELDGFVKDDDEVNHSRPLRPRKHRDIAVGCNADELRCLRQLPKTVIE